jgi:hypothetical protein
MYLFNKAKLQYMALEKQGKEVFAIFDGGLENKIKNWLLTLF